MPDLKHLVALLLAMSLLPLSTNAFSQDDSDPAGEGGATAEAEPAAEDATEPKADEPAAEDGQPEDGEKEGGEEDASEGKDEQKNPFAEAEKNKAPAIERWNKLQESRLETIRELQRLKKEFATASDSRKREINTQMQSLIADFGHTQKRELYSLAEEVYKESPDNVAAAEIVLSQSASSGDSERAIKIGTQLIEGGRRTPLVFNSMGKAHLGLGNYPEAVASFEMSSRLGSLSREASQISGFARMKMKQYETEMERRKEEEGLEGDKTLPRVKLTTSKGEIELVLHEDDVPNLVANFIDLVESNTYDKTRFHLVYEGDIVMGGNPETTEWDEDADYSGNTADFTVDDETGDDAGRMHLAGAISLAGRGPDSGATQFLITLRPTPRLDFDPESGLGKVPFGRVVKGMEIVKQLERGDELKAAEVLSKRPHDYKPERKPLAAAPGRPGGSKPEGSESGEEADKPEDAAEEPETATDTKADSDAKPTEETDASEEKSDDSAATEESKTDSDKDGETGADATPE